MLENFSFIVPEVLFGKGVLDQLGDQIRDLGADKVMIFTDKGLMEAGVVDSVSSILEKEDISYSIFDQVESEPSVANAQLAYSEAKKAGANLLIGLGGGSSMDVTKLTSILIKHSGEPRDYLGVDNCPGRGVPTILIPTTSGTGSEVSKYAIFDDRQKGTKLGAVSPYMVTDLALVDPELTVSMPPQVTASTGCDAFIHAVEGYLSPRATTLTDHIALKSIELIFNNLPDAFADGENIVARHNMSYGSLLAGIVLNNAGASSSHALAYPIGSEYHVPHGVGCMLTFLEVMNSFSMASIEKFVKMAEIFGVNVNELSPSESAEQAVEEMRKMVEYVQIPHKLRDIDMDKGFIEPFAKSVVENQQRLITNVPRKLRKKDIIDIYERSY